MSERQVRKIKNFFRCRQHPIKIISYTSKNLWLLIIPLTKYLIAARFNFQDWIKTNWIDILTIAGIIGLAIIRWAFVRFEAESDGIKAHTGLLGMFSTKIYYNQITTMSCVQSVFLRPFKASTMYIETNAKVVADVDLKLILSQKNIDYIYNLITDQCKDKPRLTVKPKKKYLFAFSFLFSSTLTGMIIFATFMFQLYQLVGKEIEREIFQRVNGEITRLNTEFFRFTRQIPKIILIIAFVVICGWGLSFMANLIRHWSFRATRCGSQIIIESGVITRRKHVINCDKINYIDYEKSLLMKIFGVCSVTVFCTGYGVKHREISVLIPITTEKEIRKSLKILLPGVPHSSFNIKTSVSDIRRFLYLPVALTFIPLVCGYIVKEFTDKWHYEIDVITIIALIPFVWKIVVSIVASFSTSIGYRKGFFTLSYCSFFRFHQVIISKENVSKFVISQTVFQKRSGRCKVKIYTSSQNTKVHTIKNMPYKEIVSGGLAIDI